MLTRRGALVVGIVLLGLFMSWRFGARALNALVAPLLVGLVAGGIQVLRMRPPEVVRGAPDHGTVGEETDVELHLRAEKGFDATVDERVREGASADGVPVGVIVADTTVNYRLRLSERGEHRIGPTTVTARDVLGLWETSFECGSESRVLAFPRVRPFRGAARTSLDSLARGGPGGREFEQLREYAPGDPMQDVHWKSSAKRPPGDMLVKEYETPVESRTVTVVASAAERHADEMAEAAASVATHLLDRDLSVALVTADGSVPHGSGEGHRRELLALLARTEGGAVDGHRDADVLVSGTERDETVHVRVGERRYTFEQLTGATDSTGVTDAADATDATAGGGNGPSAVGDAETAVSADGGEPL